MRAIVGIVGAVLTLVVLGDLVSAMLVPRGGRAPIARATVGLVMAVYRGLARLPRGIAAQHRLLATAAPVALLVMLVVYMTVFILTTGMLIYGLSPLDVTNALYQSGSTLTTLGIVAAVTGPSAIAAFVAAFLGLVSIAVFVGYLLGLYSSYTARESLIARWSTVAGEPAWAPAAFARGHLLGIAPEQLLDSARWTDWTCDLRTNFTVSPIIAWFRSPSPFRHWSTTLLSALDVAALRLACGIDSTRSDDIVLLSEGVVTVSVMHDRHGDRNLDAERAVLAALSGSSSGGGSDRGRASSGISDDDWMECSRILVTAGLADAASEQGIRHRFEALRALYAPSLCRLALTYRAVPAPWSGPRSPQASVLMPEMPDADEATTGRSLG